MQTAWAAAASEQGAVAGAQTLLRTWAETEGKISIKTSRKVQPYPGTSSAITPSGNAMSTLSWSPALKVSLETLGTPRINDFTSPVSLSLMVTVNLPLPAS